MENQLILTNFFLCHLYMTCASKQIISLNIFSLHFIFPDLWGRLENESGLTASNVAKYDALHSMVVFKEHSPSHWNKVQLKLTR